MTFKDEVITELNKPLAREHIKQREKGGASLSYVEGWHVIAEANRIFGHGDWTRETVEMNMLHSPEQNERGNIMVSYSAKVRITAGGVVREGWGFGSQVARFVGDAHEGAIKEAETDAMKRALMTFGNPFGLALYDKAQVNVETTAQMKDRQYNETVEFIRAVKTVKEFEEAKLKARTLYKGLDLEKKNELMVEVTKKEKEIAPKGESNE